MSKKTTSVEQLHALKSLANVPCSNEEFAVLLGALYIEPNQNSSGSYELKGTNVHAKPLELAHFTKLARALQTDYPEIRHVALINIALLAETQAVRRVPISTQFFRSTNTDFDAFSSLIKPQFVELQKTRESALQELGAMLDLLKVDFERLPNGSAWMTNLTSKIWKTQPPKIVSDERPHLKYQLETQAKEYVRLYNTFNRTQQSKLSAELEGHKVSQLVKEPNHLRKVIEVGKKKDLQTLSDLLASEIKILKAHQLNDAETQQQSRQLAIEIRNTRQALVKTAIRSKVYEVPGGQEALEWRDTVNYDYDPLEKISANVLTLQKHITLLSQYQPSKK